MWRDILIVPFQGDEPYDFGESDLHRQIAAQTHTVFRYLDRFQPAVECGSSDNAYPMRRIGITSNVNR